jgi:hypothetical protein
MARKRGGRQCRMRIGAFAFVILAGVSNAFAGDDAAPLTASDIAAFVATWPQTAQALSAADPEFDPALTGALDKQLQEMAASDSKDSDLDHAAGLAGFADFDAFAARSSRILLAAQWARDPPDAAGLAAAIAAVEADANRTSAERTELISALKKGYGKALEDKPADADIDAVKPFLTAVNKAIGVDG